MADTPPKSPPASDISPRDKEPGGYARLARKWSAFSSNLLASGLVIVAAIALLRYVAPWWKEDKPPSARAHLAETVGQGIDTEDPYGVLAGFGDVSRSLRQARFDGDREGARQQLRQLCRHAVATSPKASRKVGLAEWRVLKGLRATTPVAVEAGKWRMYETDGPAPIVAVVPWSDSAELDEEGISESLGVLSWGIAIPGDDSNWTLFAYPGSGSDLSTVPGLPGVELPRGTARTMSLTGENGVTMLAFSGPVDADACRRHFDHWAIATKTRQIAPWRKIGQQWLARFGDEESGWVDIHLFDDGGRLTGGFLAVSSGANSAAAKK